MFHCHFEAHLVNGMFLIIEVGERSEMKQPPPDFPRCSAYLPTIKNLGDYGPPSCHCGSDCACDSGEGKCQCSDPSSSNKKSCSCKSCGGSKTNKGESKMNMGDSKMNMEPSGCHCSKPCSCGSSGSACQCPKPSPSKINYGKYEPTGRQDYKKYYEKYIPESNSP